MPGVHLFPGGMGFTGADVSPASVEMLPTQGAPYTVEAWIRPQPDASVAAIVGWGDWGVENKTQCLLLQSTKEIEDTWWGSRLAAPLQASLADGVFHHVAATWDGATRKLFVDFEEVASGAAAPNAVTSTDTLCIGQAGWDEADIAVCPFKGALRDLRIWSVARSAAELRARGAAG
ncbi:unnamed protein product [Prorocentrum cordatum]|uniref:LamG-like jellyroll fold domain-containing protein n=1 Tax=Prorocentrum cordatum TaxID=2364126 RepID=A0ABN9PDS2_9DINO|nr:unnamed protein product [Polarella glacialis]